MSNLFLLLMNVILAASSIPSTVFPADTSSDKFNSSQYHDVSVIEFTADDLPEASEQDHPNKPDPQPEDEVEGHQRIFVDITHLARLYAKFKEDETSANSSTEDDSAPNEDKHVSWRVLMKRNKLAYTIWNITNKNAGFKSRDEAVEKCLLELKDRRKALAPYLVSTTISDSSHFLRNFNNIVSKYSHLHDLTTVQKYYREYIEVLQDYEEYSFTMHEIIRTMDQRMKYLLICAQRRYCSCFTLSDVEVYENQFSRLSSSKIFIKLYLIFGYYIDPIIRSLFLVVGIIFNFEVLAIFVKNVEVRTEYNIMILNIVVTNILMLIIYMPIHYIHIYFSPLLPHSEFTNNGVFILVQATLISSSVLSLFILKVQQHTEVSTPATSPPLPAFWRGALLFVCLWVTAIGVAVFIFVFKDYPSMGYILAPVAYITLYITLLSISLTKLKLSLHKTPSRLVNSDVILAFSKLFWATHVPLFVWLLLEGLCGFALKLAYINYSYIDVFVYYLHFSYACFSPFVLCKSSGNYKTLLYKYVSMFLYKQKKEQDIMLRVTQQPESQTNPRS
ncbi:uncharacterized protein [Periplaneta americana]|uniref:uncharacterized protein n=1 Tax=Periplaneta americana TaxID=6978 RepID=UPI0037E8A63B